MPASHTVGGVLEIRTELQRVMDRRTEVQTDKGKTICPSSFGDGGIIKQQGAGGGLFGHFLLSSIFSLLFLPLSGRRPDID